jgi:hypothetical protein
MENSGYEPNQYYSSRSRLFNRTQIDYINMYASKHRGIGPSIPYLLILSDELPLFEDRYFKSDPKAGSLKFMKSMESLVANKES